MRRWLPVLSASILALMLVLAAGCGDGDEEEAPAGGSPGEIKMELNDFFFEPKDLNASAGQTLTLELENEGDAPHTFTIDELGIDEQVAPGENATVTVTPEQDGEIPFYCRFHLELQGMQGTITVRGGSGASQGGVGPTGSGGGYFGE